MTVQEFVDAVRALYKEHSGCGPEGVSDCSAMDDLRELLEALDKGNARKGEEK